MNPFVLLFPKALVHHNMVIVMYSIDFKNNNFLLYVYGNFFGYMVVKNIIW